MNRRAFLGGTTAGALLWAMGCHPPAPEPIVALANNRAVRDWLRDAVTRLAAVYPTAGALATSRRRVTCAVDVLGEGVSRGRVDGFVLAVRDAAGAWREQASSDLSRDGVARAAAVLVGRAPRPGKTIAFGAPIVAPALVGLDPHDVPDLALVARARKMLDGDPAVSSRIVYTAGVIDVDDAQVWSVAPGRDQEQRLVRVRRSVTRVAWSGTRPVVGEAARGWIGGLDDQTLAPAEVSRATIAALALMTPGTFSDGELAIALDPSVTALVIDTATRSLLTGTAAQLPEVARRLAVGAAVASPALTLVDDPTVRGAYGGFHFDDEGTPAAALTLLDQGHVVGRLADRATAGAGPAGRGRRAGHVGRVEPWPSHLRLAPGTGAFADLLADGYRLEGAIDASLDPSSNRITVSVARAFEVRNGHDTGRVFADVELVGDLAALLAGATAVGAEPQTFALRDERDGQPRWRSIEAAGVITRGLVRARRRAA